MYQDVEVWDIVAGTLIRPPDSNSDKQADWDKKNKAALGALHRRVDTGPMTHIAQATLVSAAWNVLKSQYQSLGVAGMTMLRNKFTSLRMAEAL
ncbi:hypothetical protein RSOLAG1IB_11671 [Rhizoctonia solani AG-1 IB]|uniref:Uncharacterized protein n=1 Tax=Thanatephorus cucumeris (strain AG1-IB / isolate 7/3/14) TaxID=1108050 RepID=M5C6F3_THACB|nr:hypothetical protein BN14_08759 [Rhizoctonia solani AG-1 IB]CEL54425.1 hypothetical protein RSOLAG1IB_11671 [Rhizoctonia solani AG-1 IB]